METAALLQFELQNLKSIKTFDEVPFASHLKLALEIPGHGSASTLRERPAASDTR